MDNLVSFSGLAGDEDIGDLVFFVGVSDGFKEIPIFKEFFIFFSFFHAGISDNMVEGLSIKSPELAVAFRSDGGSSGCVIEESEFSEIFTWLIGFEIFGLWLIRVLFEAIKFTRFYDVEFISFFSLINDPFSGAEFSLFHGGHDDLLFLLIKIAKHENFIKSLLNFLFYLIRFGDDSWFKIFLLIKLSIDFSRDRCSLLFWISCFNHYFLNGIMIFFRIRR